MQGRDIRETFLQYFESKEHARVASSSLVPQGDPTLLFTNAGMVQFKDVFLGREARPYRRATTSQKCVRAGGKHNDLDNVGRTARHHTFFEMLGNFSFGDYFKPTAIEFAWELLTERFKLPKDRLWATVYCDDDEAADLWSTIAGVPAERIVRLGEKDNFWSMGDTGPCGPCSEIIVDRGEEHRCTAETCGIGECDCDRFLEIWNLVFMQFNRDAEGTMTPLPKPSVDTGMGLERMTAVLQNVPSNWDTDLLLPIIRRVEEMSGQQYHRDDRGFPFRVIADHARCVTFLISDGVLPSNEGRGYVLRRILRRAARYGRRLGFNQPFLAQVGQAVLEVMGDAYPDIRQRYPFVERVLTVEEEKFGGTLATGLSLLDESLDRMNATGGRTLDGEEAFRLYDTFGFPYELTEEIALERGLEVDRAAFDAAMARQRATARGASKFGRASQTSADTYRALGIPNTEFVGYDPLTDTSVIVGLLQGGESVERAEAGSDVDIVTMRTSFYAEAGGQVGDTGTVTASTGVARVLDTQRPIPELIVHRSRVESGALELGSSVELTVDAERREDIRRHHTATHLLHKALRNRLGTHVQQAGSLVAPDRLRFDFSHYAPLSPDDIREIEREVNEEIRTDVDRNVEITSYAEAVKRGAMALFGEKYGDVVRLVEFGDYSRELCGGTHVDASGQIGSFVVVSESSVAAGVRRIEALAGRAAERYLRERIEQLDRLADILHSQDLEARVVALQNEVLAQKREIERLQRQHAGGETDKLLAQAQLVDGFKVLAARVDSPNIETLRALGDQLRAKLGPSVVTLGTVVDSKPSIVVMVTPGVNVHAGDLARQLGEVVEGRGGGRPDVAQAGGKNPARIDEALNQTVELVRRQTAGSATK